MSKNEIKESLEYNKYKTTLLMLIILGIFMILFYTALFIFAGLSLPQKYKVTVLCVLAIFLLPCICIYLFELITICKKRICLINSADKYSVLEAKINQKIDTKFGKHKYEVSFIYDNEKKSMTSSEFRDDLEGKILIGYDKNDDNIILIKLG